jgi:hypothetical protein
VILPRLGVPKVDGVMQNNLFYSTEANLYSHAMKTPVATRGKGMYGGYGTE